MKRSTSFGEEYISFTEGCMFFSEEHIFFE